MKIEVYYENIFSPNSLANFFFLENLSKAFEGLIPSSQIGTTLCQLPLKE